jgi:hypothetical protein
LFINTLNVVGYVKIILTICRILVAVHRTAAERNIRVAAGADIVLGVDRAQEIVGITHRGGKREEAEVGRAQGVEKWKENEMKSVCIMFWQSKV